MIDRLCADVKEISDKSDDQTLKLAAKYFKVILR